MKSKQKANIENQNGFDNMDNFLINHLKSFNMAKEILEEGHPVSYTDKEGRLIEERPNGEKFLVSYDENWIRSLTPLKDKSK